MSKKTIFLKSLTAVALAGTIATGTSNEAEASPKKLEKCYGIVKAGQNDCGANGHSCAGAAEVDNDNNEWILLPQGLCERITGGSTSPKE